MRPNIHSIVETAITVVSHGRILVDFRWSSISGLRAISNIANIVIAPRAADTARPYNSIFHANRAAVDCPRTIAKNDRRSAAVPQELQFDRKLYWRAAFGAHTDLATCKIYKFFPWKGHCSFLPAPLDLDEYARQPAPGGKRARSIS
jgi:hypothetical protein